MTLPMTSRWRCVCVSVSRCLSVSLCVCLCVFVCQRVRVCRQLATASGDGKILFWSLQSNLEYPTQGCVCAVSRAVADRDGYRAIVEWSYHWCRGDVQLLVDAGGEAQGRACEEGAGWKYVVLPSPCAVSRLYRGVAANSVSSAHVASPCIGCVVASRRVVCHVSSHHVASFVVRRASLQARRCRSPTRAS